MAGGRIDVRPITSAMSPAESPAGFMHLFDRNIASSTTEYAGFPNIPIRIV
jgi:hypothetical protein